MGPSDQQVPSSRTTQETPAENQEWCLLCQYLELWCLLSLSFTILNLEQYLYWPLAENISLSEYLDLLQPPKHLPDTVMPWEVFPLLKSTGALALPQPWEMLNRGITKEQAMWEHMYGVCVCLCRDWERAVWNRERLCSHVLKCRAESQLVPGALGPIL